MKIKITKRFLLSLCLMTLTLLCGGNKAWGQTTATLNFGTNNVQIDEKTVTATDTKGNTWTITTVGTSSFSQNSDYSQVGSSKKPAKSITFTTTLPSKSTIKAFSAKFGGFSGTAGTISLKVDDTEVGTGSLNETSDVTVNNTSTPLGQKLTITITDISKGVKCYNISVTYQASTPTLEYTVSWKVNDADYTEGAPTTKVADGSSVTTLPTVPSDIAGKTFVGWTNAEIATPSASAPTTLFTKAAKAPAVTSDVTYYAVFASASGTGESSEELTGEEITNLGLLDYDKEKTYSGDKLKYSIFGYKDSPNGANRPWIQLNKDQGSYIKITAPDNITKMNLKISSATNSKGGIEDISKHTIFSKTDKVGLVTEDCSFTTSSKNIGSILGKEISNNLVTIETTSESKVVYLKVSTGARIWGITTYFSDLTYSNYVTTVPLSFSFSDTDDLTEYLPTSPLADQTVILNRYVYSGWNTFCVPFALTQAQLEEAYGSGAVAKYLSDVTTGTEGVTLHFTPEAEGGIKANKAYLLYLTDDVTEAKTFSGVTLEPAGTCTTTVKANNNDVYTFQGILKPTTLTTNGTQYFLNSAGTYFVLPRADSSPMKATRAYIIVPAPAAPAQGRQYSFDFNGTTTAIDNVTVSGMEDGAWYTISGIRINRPAAKGVYIHNGRKVIVK